jgi:hypothetical protein
VDQKKVDEILVLIPDADQVNDCLRYYGKEALIERLALARKKLEELKSKTG